MSKGKSHATVANDIILGVIYLTIIILKAFGLIDLSWIWIFAPIWVPVGLIVAVAALFTSIFIIVMLVGTMVYIVEEISELYRTRKEKNNNEDIK